MKEGVKHEAIPDLKKDSPEFRAHGVDFNEINIEARRLHALLCQVLGSTKDRIERAGNGANKGKLPPLEAINKDTHINCYGAHILFHHIGMEAYRKEFDGKGPADLRPLLRHVASVRLSLLQYPLTKSRSDFRPEIEAFDNSIAAAAGADVEVPSLTPFLFKPHTAINQFKKVVNGNKFKDPELLLQLGELFVTDNHVLHSLSMSLVQEGNFEAVEMLLLDRANQLYPQFGNGKIALNTFLQNNVDLFAVFVMSLVEGGRPADAVRWCEKAPYNTYLLKNEKLAEKYAAALRGTESYEEAMRFVEKAEAAGMKSKALKVQYDLARDRNPSVLIGSEYERWSAANNKIYY